MDIASMVKASASSGQNTDVRLLRGTDSSAEEFCRSSSIHYTLVRNKDKVAMLSNTVNCSCLLLEGSNCAS